MAVKNFLLEIAAKNREKIFKYLDTSELREKLEKHVKEKWRKYTPNATEPVPIAGVDGSVNTVEFKTFSVYAAVGYSLERNNGKIEEHIAGDVGVISTPNVQDVVRLIREICELKASLMSTAELILHDGSMMSLLIPPIPLLDKEGGLKEVYEKLKTDYGEEVIGSLRHQLEALKSTIKGAKTLYEPFASTKLLGFDAVGPYPSDSLMLLLYAEKLFTLGMILEERISKSNNSGVAFVSKTSRSKQYVEDLLMELQKADESAKAPYINDMALFELFTDREPGYSHPISFPMVYSSESTRYIKRSLLDYGILGKILNQYFGNLDLLITYIRLEKNGPVAKLEIPVPSGLSDKSRVKIVENFMDVLYTISHRGYPPILTLVDTSSKIHREDIKRLISVLGIMPEFTGREVLEEWEMWIL